MFEIQIKTVSCYEFIEKSRVNLSEIIGECTDVDMVFNKTDHAMLFTTKTYNKSLSHLTIMIYNLNAKHIEEIFEAFENPGKLNVFVVDHVIVASFCNNQIKLFGKNLENKYTMLKFLVVDFSESLINYTWCCCNRYSQILFFHLKNGKICIFDVFHTSNNTFLTYDEKYPEIYFNETGEEIYVLYDQKVSIYLYKSMFKTLLQQCAFVVAKTYTKCQLYNMKLPKRLYKYLLIS